ncbi:dTDP-4-dehydrorhamnose 3,5-epimerase [Methanococcus aeolicus]|uniref:dTDP-4-dehydrorhamnose 3,5-epimerase n=1 Tax=Methanococcus aeolicus (strain ATCC BAA-1280 / DSM 17508 / OCM 812 / Nankai-3) TaxID=419665 RepID=A6UTZ8_META3|nr:dTDP-4-dehydrorhamnose 3,5-epimerase [Methanococcus aeolicus]ABR55970.1 dTDP-4-dehydrorhamnose 3,5-epimerase [Methanococcus aeolicus Nankai-3]UXM85428.1 dTDP-4-dehydrorhamnose 3,5-epimerase [Methanococcus aeolicus]
MPFEFMKTKISEVILIKPKIFGDERGFFLETYEKEDFENAGIKGEFVQDNHSKSCHGVLRGLHFQKEPYAQAKIVRCIKGVIFDVAVDLRGSSPTFGQWVGVVLSEYNKHQLYIPRGFAHGFCVLSDEAEVVYKVDNKYAPECECGVIWNDEDIGIDWLIDEPILSDKDKQWHTLKELDEKGELF